ncbi:cytochrome-c peroxidase (plasmid) [Fulvitalea axinellae]|uniref:Cytochrome-c peroxidase n=1 Tax=Fulvitalea axinellae TaxID=1182444 RepID=A0AAU9DI25_9BACT|nr:cytochrome-c peroxidase [Fulvitalea axinellae]
MKYHTTPTIRFESLVSISFYTLCFVLLFACCSGPKQVTEKTPLKTVENIYKSDLELCAAHLDSITTSDDIDKHFALAREYFKRAEPILAYVDKDNYKSLNQPNILSVEEEDLTDIKINNPFGLQVMEEQLAEEQPDTAAIKENSRLTENRVRLILHNTKLKLENHHIIWLVRESVVRVSLTGITGFDSPAALNSLLEAVTVYESLRNILSAYRQNFSNENLYNEWLTEIDRTTQALKGDFDRFDRYSFLKFRTAEQLRLINRTIKDWEVEFPFELALRNDAVSLFAPTAFNVNFFTDYRNGNTDTESKIVLGKKLFLDKRLSRSGQMSCATCHDEKLAFTDGLKTFPKQKRNTPTLLYSGMQKAFFYDNRAGSLEGQIAGVVKNKNEFHSDMALLTETVKADSAYAKSFRKIYGKRLNHTTIRNAIASYVRSLAPFDSKFDRNVNGSENTLTASEIRGFNLFSGKAKCATCHFPPLFNGTIPPEYKRTELEALAVPADKSEQPEIDPDLGRYELFKTEERKHFFKTPTVRNIAETAPYMHNGVYDSLEEVMEFYNNGGGHGLGIRLEHQTLPTDSLHLNKREIKDIIAFMRSLNDQAYERNNKKEKPQELASAK